MEVFPPIATIKRPIFHKNLNRFPGFLPRQFSAFRPERSFQNNNVRIHTGEQMNNKRLLSIAIAMGCLGSSALVGAAALEEVIITAQKTEETIQSVPISIQALDTKMLESNSVQSFSDIKSLVPSLRITPMPTAASNLIVSIRGIPAGAVELSQDTPTAVHINGVYIARGNGLDMSVADLERIEVLRGPQGTLYGRNATAGAINLITSKPTDEFAFKQQITLAEQDQRISKTSVNVPITDQLFAKVAYLYDQKEGYVRTASISAIAPHRRQGWTCAGYRRRISRSITGMTGRTSVTT
jgi:outer membrane receptor protein involved in Fe transport